MLDFLNAVLDGTLPAGCATAAPLTGAAMAYDAGTAILFGGCCTASGTVSGATERFDAATGSWQPMTISGNSPPPRLGAAFGYDPTSDDLVLFGGEYLPGGSAQPQTLNDTWELSYDAATKTGTWTQVDGTGCLDTCPGAPLPRYGAAAAQAPGGQGLVLYGGENLITAKQTGFPIAYGDTWLWANGTWTQLSPAGSPDPRYGATLAYAGPQAGTDVLFGGSDPDSGCTVDNDGCLNLLNDTWTLAYDQGTGNWTWAEQGSAPAGLVPRYFAAAATAAGTPAGGVVLFGGLTGTSEPAVNTEQLLADTWTWNSASSTWTQSCPACSTTPPPSFGASMAYQQNDDQDPLYGGYTDLTAPAAPATTWIWNGSTWTSP
jgi:hypothetical protein